MDIKNSPLQKRQSVKDNYDRIAKQYSHDFGTFIEDLDIYQDFEKHLSPNATVLDLGAGTGRTYAYFHKKGFNYIALDFSSKMRDCAYQIHGTFPYIIDDIINIKNHFDDNSVDSVFAVYSLFHLPKNDFKKAISDIYDILKPNGVFIFSYQRGEGEEYADEPYLGKDGKNALYMNYQTDSEISNLLKENSFDEIFSKEKIETDNSAINSNSVTTVFKIAIKK